jgi:thiol-disulfide isomerase/thioredoxin
LKKLLIASFLLFFNLAVHAQAYKVYDSLPQLQERIRLAGDTTLIINFWATWCKPCIEELPCFEDLRRKYPEGKVQIVLVSLDFKSQLEKKFIPFLRNQQLNCEVVLFTDQDANTWIPSIEEEWDGAIPATMVIKGKKRDFTLGKFESLSDLEKFISPYVLIPQSQNGNGK